MAEQTPHIPFEDSQENLLVHLTKLIHLNKHYGFYQLCPKCDGEKTVTKRNPGLTAATTEPCGICGGVGMVPRPEIKKDNV